MEIASRASSLLALAAAVTAVYARRFRTRHGLSLFGDPERVTREVSRSR
ncbi:hypothetical protein [Streptomyces sp. NPDC058145]